MRSHFDIFISYRRNGGSERAEMLKLMFEKNGYSSKKIFMDTHTLKASDVKPRLQEAVEASDNFILLVTKGCFDKIKEEDLWIFEIKEAIKNHKNIIPVFFDGIESFDGIDLPLDLQLLSSKNGVEYNHKYSDACFNKICSFLVHKPNPNIRFLIIVVSVLVIIIVFLSYKIYSYYSKEKDFVRPGVAWYDKGEIGEERIRKDDNYDYSEKKTKRIIELAVAQELGAQYYYTEAGQQNLVIENNKVKLEKMLSNTKDDSQLNHLKKLIEEIRFQIHMAKDDNKDFYETPTGVRFDLKEIVF